jgi:nitroreductase
MDIMEAIRLRKSIRGYKPDPVPREVLREILETATRAPSSMNTQPWEITVVTGQALDNIKQAMTEMLKIGATPHPLSPSRPFEGVYRQRQIEVAVQIFKLMGIAREDMEKRAEWLGRGQRYYDAPAVFFISIDNSLQERTLLDIGALAQTICLIALNYSLGTCIDDQGIPPAEVVKKFTSIPQSKRIAMCIAVGYPDWDFPANRLESTREPLENVTTWCTDD